MKNSIIIFEVVPKKDGVDGMFKNVEVVVPTMQNVPGFISVEPFTSLTNEGKYCFLCIFDSEESANNWKNNINHRKVQNDGHDNLFDNYKITVTSVVREYTNEDRTQAPTDSNKYLNE